MVNLNIDLICCKCKGKATNAVELQGLRGFKYYCDDCLKPNINIKALQEGLNNGKIKRA